MKIYNTKKWRFNECDYKSRVVNKSFLFWSWQETVTEAIPKYRTKEDLMAEVNKFIQEKKAEVVTMTGSAEFERVLVIEYGCDDYYETYRTGEITLVYYTPAASPL